MDAKQIISIICGILSLVAIFLFTLFTFEVTGDIYYVSGINGVKRILNIFFESISMIYIIGAITLLIFLFSGILQIIGAKERSLTIIGSILPLFFGLIIILDSFNLLPKSFIGILYILGDPERVIPDILPFDYVITDRTESIGTYLLILSGSLGLISGLLKRGGD